MITAEEDHAISVMRAAHDSWMWVAFMLCLQRQLDRVANQPFSVFGPEPSRVHESYRKAIVDIHERYAPAEITTYLHEEGLLK